MPLKSAPESTHSLTPFAPKLADRRVWQDYLEPVRLSAGQSLFRQGDQADSIYFIESGELQVWLELPGADRVKLRQFGPGDCLGEMALYRQEARTASVEAGMATLLWRLTAAQLAALEQSAPALAIAMHRHVVSMLSDRLAHNNTHLKAPLARLAQAICSLAESEFATTLAHDPRVAEAALRLDEVGAVASAIQYLQQRLQSYLADLARATAAREQIESELRIAGRIQLSFLPPPLAPADAKRVDFASYTRPAREAGGDLYDGFFLDDRRFFFVIGDVCGKGVPAALFMAVTAMCLRALAPSVDSPDHLLKRVNELLCQRNDTMQFVTLITGTLDTVTGDLIWANCGHPAPVLVDPRGGLVWLDDGRGPPAGVFEGADYSTQRRTLQRDQVLVLYTDGVTEALDPDAALYSEARLADLLALARPAHAQACVDLIIRDVNAFARGAPQADDLTLIALRPVCT